MEPDPKPGSFLKLWHQQSADSAIDGHDEHGAWRESFFAQFLTDAVPLVIDANVLHDCVGRTAERRQRTALTSIANGRGARAFCAPHVIEELYEHHAEWAERYHVTPDAYRAVFEEQYKPLLRVVPTDGVDQMLMPDEAERIEWLRARDADDVPTATLAIAMGAMPVTMDTRPWRAVYGVDADPVGRTRWLDALMSVGDLAESEKFMTGAHATIGSVAVGTIVGAVRLFRFSPALFAAAALGAITAAICVPEEKRKQAWHIATAGFQHYTEELAYPHIDAIGVVATQRPPFPDWDELVNSTSRDAALGRACLFELARNRKTLARASEVSKHLPDLAIGQDAMRIGTALRRFPAFFEPYHMHWQVGRRFDRLVR